MRAFFEKHRELLLYIFFGGCTTLVSVGSFVLFDSIFHIHELLANILSWILAVGFAYVTNRRWVFCSTAKGKAVVAEAAAFYGGRLLTLGLEEVLLLIFVTWLSFPGAVVKLIAQFVVLAGNYILSKLLIFRKK